eukprot:INCI5101.1.p2 GENE.INCI5101.1~~INCI5101.1.p2  ORF type:complete len:482 (+),score=69.48 INCI5101.1:239-1684(+)
MLQNIAQQLGPKQTKAAELFTAASIKDDAGLFHESIVLYQQAFRLWPALDSGNFVAGVPQEVLAEAAANGVAVAEATAAAEEVLDTSLSPRFDVGATEKWLAYLEEEGYVVIAGAADPRQIARARELLWDFFEDASKDVRRDDSSTWTRQQGWLPDPGNGIISHPGFAHSEFAWSTRLLPAVQEAFRAVWKTEDVISSFDTGNAFRPWNAEWHGAGADPLWKTGGGWWHVDQNALLPGMDKRVCVQGLVTYKDATRATGGLCVVPGSHRQHSAVCARASAERLSHYVQVHPTDPVLRCSASGGVKRPKLVCAQAGDLVLWDSRCVHCNTPGLGPQQQPLRHHGDHYHGGGGGTQPDQTSTNVQVEESEEKTNDESARDHGQCAAADSNSPPRARLIRIVSYVCMTPASWASTEVLNARKIAFEKCVATNHWPHFHPPVMVEDRLAEASGDGHAGTGEALQSLNDCAERKRRLVVGCAFEAP